jgi:hypothetical protein
MEVLHQTILLGGPSAAPEQLLIRVLTILSGVLSIGRVKHLLFCRRYVDVIALFGM